MFHSFFPNPKWFFLSFVLWSIFCVVLWFGLAIDWGATLSLGGLFGYGFPEALVEPISEDVQTAFDETREPAQNFWFYQYMALSYAAFCLFWMLYSPHRWGRWSVLGSALIIFVTWYQVQIDVMLNSWYRDFFDMVQRALAEPNSVSLDEYYGTILTAFWIVMPYMIVTVLKVYFTQHYVFRWRTAMNERYVAIWKQVRHIEGASQRVQDDTMRFARIVEGLGVSVIDSFMTLIAFLPILWVLSENVKEIPIFGAIPQALVVIAIGWSVFGTGLVYLAGLRLPGLEFRNQRVEASFRKELVYGEDDEMRAEPVTLAELFGNVRRNYYRLFLEYVYFNVIRYTYLQIGNLIPLFAMGPTVVAGAITLGVFQQIINAFGRVENSFQFLINSWPTIIELMSIHKRLAAFEASIAGQDLAGIENEGEMRAI